MDENGHKRIRAMAVVDVKLLAPPSFSDKVLKRGVRPCPLSSRWDLFLHTLHSNRAEGTKEGSKIMTFLKSKANKNSGQKKIDTQANFQIRIVCA